ncbi:voltage-dependent anion-selective channel-like [Drosophila tropicalis]|uniref:voltage-dependent anion-selective channel-like n=1 Tax=Drosophila tropicalis TaxID=46794 RepID=UPI0035ABA385
MHQHPILQCIPSGKKQHSDEELHKKKREKKNKEQVASGEKPAAGEAKNKKEEKKKEQGSSGGKPQHSDAAGQAKNQKEADKKKEQGSPGGKPQQSDAASEGKSKKEEDKKKEQGSSGGKPQQSDAASEGKNKKEEDKKKEQGSSGGKPQQSDAASEGKSRKEEDKKKEQGSSGGKPQHSDGASGPISDEDSEIIPPPLVEGQVGSYFNVGRWAKDCLIRGYNYGVFHMECGTSTYNDVGLTTFGSAYPDFKNILGGVEIRKQLGPFHLSHNWLSSNEWLSEAGVETPIAGGIFSALLRTAYSKQENFEYKAKVKTGFELSPIKMELALPVVNEPKAMGYFVVAPATNWLLGYRAVYNLEEKAFDKHAFCLGYYNGTSEVGVKMENFEEVRGSIFRRLGERFAVALQTDLYGGGETRRIAFGGQYMLDSGSLLKAKVKEDGNMGLVYQSKLSENIEISYHFGFDSRSPIDGDHKIGVAWILNS